MAEMTEAPSIRGNYPLAGERIGPAWRRTWSALADGEWHKGNDVARAVREDLHPETIMTLLRQAVRAGLLEGEKRKGARIGGTSKVHSYPVWYRRADLVG